MPFDPTYQSPTDTPGEGFVPYTKFDPTYTPPVGREFMGDVAPQEYYERATKAGLATHRLLDEQKAYLAESGIQMTPQMEREYKKGMLDRYWAETDEIPGGWMMRAARKSIPGASGFVEGGLAKKYANAVERHKRNESTDDDLSVMAEYEALQNDDARRGSTILGGINEAIASAPAIISEVGAGTRVLGSLGVIGRAPVPIVSATHLGRMAALTPLTPSMYMSGTIAKNVENGRDPLDIRGFGQGMAHAYANMLVLGSMQNAFGSIRGAGVRAAIGETALKGGIGVAEQGVVDSATNLLDTILPKNAKLSAGYGTFENLMEGKFGEAGKHAAVQMFTFSMFAGLHRFKEGGQRAERYEALRKLRGQRDVNLPLAEEIADAGAKAEEVGESFGSLIDTYRKSGKSPEAAFEAVNKLTTKLAETIQGRNSRGEELTVSDARNLIPQDAPPAVRKAMERLIDTLELPKKPSEPGGTEEGFRAFDEAIASGRPYPEALALGKQAAVERTGLRVEKGTPSDAAVVAADKFEASLRARNRFQESQQVYARALSESLGRGENQGKAVVAAQRAQETFLAGRPIKSMGPEITLPERASGPEGVVNPDAEVTGREPGGPRVPPRNPAAVEALRPRSSPSRAPSEPGYVDQAGREPGTLPERPREDVIPEDAGEVRQLSNDELIDQRVNASLLSSPLKVGVTALMRGASTREAAAAANKVAAAKGLPPTTHETVRKQALKLFGEDAVARLEASRAKAAEEIKAERKWREEIEANTDRFDPLRDKPKSWLGRLKDWLLGKSDAPAPDPTLAPEWAKKFDDAIDSADLPAATKAEYKAAMRHTMATIPEAGRKYLAEYMKEAKFYPDVKEMGLAAIDAILAQKDIGPKYRQEMVDLRKAVESGEMTLGGGFVKDGKGNGFLFLDGKTEAGTWSSGRYGPGGREMGLRYIYSHELGHGIDGANRRFSSTKEWEAAHAAEFGRDASGQYRLTEYAYHGGNKVGEKTLASPSEGFAEFARLLYGSDVPTAQIARDFRRASAFFKDRGLWPAERGGPTEKMPEVFGKRYPAEGVDHADGLADFMRVTREEGENRPGRTENERGVLEEVQRDPLDRTNRLVLADAVQEAGYEKNAEAVRREIDQPPGAKGVSHWRQLHPQQLREELSKSAKLREALAEAERFSQSRSETFDERASREEEVFDRYFAEKEARGERLEFKLPDEPMVGEHPASQFGPRLYSATGYHQALGFLADPSRGVYAPYDFTSDPSGFSRGVRFAGGDTVIEYYTDAARDVRLEAEPLNAARHEKGISDAHMPYYEMDFEGFQARERMNEALRDSVLSVTFGKGLFRGGKERVHPELAPLLDAGWRRVDMPDGRVRLDSPLRQRLRGEQALGERTGEADFLFGKSRRDKAGGVRPEVKLDSKNLLPRPQGDGEFKQIASEGHGLASVPIIGGFLQRIFDPGRADKTDSGKAIVAWDALGKMGKDVGSNWAAQERVADTLFAADKEGAYLREDGTRGRMADDIEAEMTKPGSTRMTPEQRAWVRDVWTPLLADAQAMLREEGITHYTDSEGHEHPINKVYFPRQAIGKKDTEGKIDSRMWSSRKYESEAEGSKTTIYEPSAKKRVASFIEGVYRTIANKRLADDPSLGGKTVDQRFEEFKAENADLLFSLDGDARKDLLDELKGRAAHPYALKEKYVQAHPMFRGKIYSAEIADKLEKVFAREQDTVTKRIEKFTAGAKSIVLGGDASYAFVQLLPTLFRRPVTWATSMKEAVKSLFDSDALQKYLGHTGNAEAARDLAQLGTSIGRPEDFMAGSAEGEWATRLPLGIGKWYKAAGRAYSTAMTVAKIELWKALKRTEKPENYRRLAESIDAMLLSGRMEGVGMTPQRRMWERVFFNAPSYYRGGLNAIATSFMRGVSGRELRTLVGALGVGSVLSAVAGMKAAGLSNDEIGDRLKPWKGKFLRVPIDLGNNQKVELGYSNILDSYIRLLAQGGNHFLSDKPADTGVDGNPILRWLRGHSGSVPRLALDLFIGRDYMGNRLSPQDAVARSVEPIIVQQLMHGEGGVFEKGIGREGLKNIDLPKRPNVADAVFSVFGFSSYPGSEQEARMAVYEDEAKKKYSKRYAELTIREQLSVSRAAQNRPDLPPKTSSPRQLESALAFQEQKRASLEAKLSKDARKKLSELNKDLPDYASALTIDRIEVPLTRDQLIRLESLLAEEYERSIALWNTERLKGATPEGRETFVRRSLIGAKERANARLVKESRQKVP